MADTTRHRQDAPDAQNACASKSGGLAFVQRLLPAQQRSNVWLAKGVLLLSLAFTAFAWRQSHEAVNRIAEARFQAQTSDIARLIGDRMRQYDALLQAGVGLFKSVGFVTRQQWLKFVEGLNLQEHFPGVQGYGFAQRVLPDELPDFERTVQDEGYPSFSLKPAGERNVYFPILYLEPFDKRNRQAFGYDMYSETVRREAMDRAADTGLAAITSRVTLVQEIDDKVQAGILMYVPVYKPGHPLQTVQDRRNALLGFVYSPFRMNDLMAGILGNAQTAIGFTIFDGEGSDPQHQLYNSTKALQQPEHDLDNIGNSDIIRLTTAGRSWTIQFHSHKNYVSQIEAAQPVIIAGAGIVVDILLYLMLLNTMGHRRRAEALAAEITTKFKQAKETAEALAARESAARQDAERTNTELMTANTSLLRFTSVAAHDLRAPLRRIESFVEVMREDYAEQLSEDAQDILDRISRSAARMSAMVSSLLNYSKCGSRSFAIKRINAAEFVKNALETLEHRHPDISIAMDIDPSFHIGGDQALLGSVLSNLINNSIKYRSAAPVHVHISGEDRGDGKITFAVTDNGIGIEPRFADRVFDMFYRLHNEDKYAGTGIGLAICKRIIGDHGGSIFVDPAYSGGTRIVFSLPKMQMGRQQILAA